MKWIIYKHTNLINGKCYIGQTMQHPADRWNDGKNYNRAFKFGRALDKYGWEGFSHEILESNILSQEDANKLEEYYIAFYDSYVRGYNSTKGGDNCDHLGKSIVQISTDIKIIKEFQSCAEAERDTGILAQNISSCILGRQLTAGGFYWALADIDISAWKPPTSRKNKPVICVETNEIYENISTASKETGVSIAGISKCALREAITAGGLHWCYFEEYDEDWVPVLAKKVGGPTRPIICVETGELFESITECSLLTGISSQNLSQNCCMAHRVGKGKHYAYLDEYDDNWEPATRYDSKRREQASTRKKQVYCLETDMFYDSCTQAGKILNIDNRLIGRCCTGELVQTNGYHFCFAQDYHAGWMPRKNRKGQKKKEKVLCVETNEIFDTAAEAGREKKINASCLSGCLNKKKETAGGYHWKYVSEDLI